VLHFPAIAFAEPDGFSKAGSRSIEDGERFGDGRPPDIPGPQLLGGDDLMPQLEEGLPVRSPEELNGLQIAIERHSHMVIVRLTGEVDVATAPELDRRLQETAAGGHTHVLIDLSEVEFMDSTGLQSIVRAQYSADSDGRRLTLRPGSPQVQRLFAITGLLDRMIFEDPET
jgi:anti-sigma B factor antagonist